MNALPLEDLDHRQFAAKMKPARRKALHQRSTPAGLRHLAGHAALLMSLGLYIALQGPFWPLFMLPYGIALMFLFTLSHECTHATPFASKRLCDVVGHAVSFPLMLPFTWFRYFHLDHHKFTNDPERDPELAGGGRPDTWPAYLLYLSGWGYWSANARVLIANARGQFDAPYLPQAKHALMQREARVLLSLYGLAAFSLLVSPLALTLWVIPALIGQPFLRLYLLAEHGHCPPVANMLENTRTTLTNRAVRFLAWNMPYHAEHHAMPMVPFHQLPELHKDMAAHLKSVSNGYGEFSAEYARGLTR
ncbi:MAG: fatty acid desaturase [Pseudomonadota bacterium]